MNMELGKVYRLFGSKTKREAIKAYTAVLIVCPMALDALQALAELGHSAKELDGYVNENKSLKFAHFPPIFARELCQIALSTLGRGFPAI